MNLSSYLKGAGLLTGSSSNDTGHTRMGWIKSQLLGNRIKIKKKERFHGFGTFVHEKFFVATNPNQMKGGKLQKLMRLNIVEKRMADGMLKALSKDAVVLELMKGTICEKTEFAKLNGVLVKYTPDAVQPRKIGIDLKTTACSELAEFIYKAFEYGYFRQGETYSRAAKLKEFYIIGITKSAPHQVFIVRIGEFKKYMAYAKQELDFLLYFYKNYGTFTNLQEKAVGNQGSKRADAKNKISSRKNCKASKRSNLARKAIPKDFRKDARRR